ncbi:hypothetical protein [Streptantibioticus cattleyicolor]|uniref:hypothetical protein n=1 Tax=Streptantibioticus cattleyicolor TaxID=29303 RepID=UPI00040D7688|nr:hypothetical protein [Streptantibioticus cattleyicolor]
MVTSQVTAVVSCACRADEPRSAAVSRLDGARTLDVVAECLALLRQEAGNPSYTTIARRVSAARAARGVPAEERTPGRVTVYDCFRAGRRRMDVELLSDIVRALGADPTPWRRAHSVASGSARPLPAVARRR